MSLLENKIAIVTGASSGLGRAIAIRYALEGASVVLADVRKEPIEDGATTLDALVAATVERFGRLDIIVNNAAIYTSTTLLQTSIEQWNRVIAVNLTGFFYCSKRAVMQMVEQEPVNEVRGRIINISSQHGMVASPGDFPYGVSKGGIVQMTRQIAVDHADDRIVCNAIAPGKIITGKPGIANDPSALDYSRSRTPWPRLGAPDDVAGAALFLASDMATFVTGVNLMVDGGWMAG
jgi:NAD(P)-dependent dehydrogenase (short-subunit alcohol dehydrogenase family)